MALHAASHYGASVVGVTLSAAQADLARLRVKEAGLEDQIEIRVQDYRDLRGERFDAISSIGMFEHVGAERMAEYFATLHALLATRAGCSTTPSPASEALGWPATRSSGATCSPTAS